MYTQMLHVYWQSVARQVIHQFVKSHKIIMQTYTLPFIYLYKHTSTIMATYNCCLLETLTFCPLCRFCCFCNVFFFCFFVFNKRPTHDLFVIYSSRFNSRLIGFLMNNSKHFMLHKIIIRNMFCFIWLDIGWEK